MKCLICGYENEDKKGFATHLQMFHKLKSKEYTIKYLNNNSIGLCPICGKETRYVSFTFRKYCKEHSNFAESEAGRRGGHAAAWNKGLTKENDERLKKLSDNMKGEKNHFYGKTHPKNMLENLRKQRFITKEQFEESLKSRSDDFEFFIKYEDYESKQYQFFNVKCKKCGFIEKKTLAYLEKGSRCSQCFPNFVSSLAEQEIIDFIKSLGIEEVEKNNRKIIPPKELDIYVPFYNFAIEYNGLYWHSEEKVGRKHHKEKTLLCQERGIDLFHIFSDEWKEKPEIVKSMIRHRLKLQKNRIYARNCIVKGVSNKEASDFYKRTHIAGTNKTFIVNFALIQNDKIVGCLSLKKPFEKTNKNVIENARFSTELDTLVVGGFSKLLKRAKEWSVNSGYKKIKSFADLRFGVGDVYEKNGFVKIGETKENYWYSKNGKRYFRTLIRANGNKTERQVADENGVYRVYGCGSNIFLLNL